MNDYTQRRLEFEKRLDTIIGGYSYAQDGGYGGYEFKDITDHIDTFIAQAEQEMLKMVEQKLLHQKECIFLGIQKEFIKKVFADTCAIKDNYIVQKKEIAYIKEPTETITIGGIKYSKDEVEKALQGIKEIK